MQKGEKVVLWLAFGAIAVVIGLAVVLEIMTQQKKAEEAAASAPGARSADAGVWMIPKGVNPAALPQPDSPGARALTLYCAQCHDLPVPAMHTADEWSGVLMRMQNIMQERRGGMLSRLVVPGENDWDTLRAYLRRHGLEPIDADQYDLNTAGAQAFMSTCSQCHGAPSPKLHSAKEWARVLLRMQNNMRAAGMEPPQGEARDAILAFLQAQSKATAE